MPTDIRRKLVQHFQYEGILLDKEALDTLVEYVSTAPDKEDAISTLSDAREAGVRVSFNTLGSVVHIQLESADRED